VPEDFAPPIPMELTFLPGTAERCANISISNDTILEDDELFSVQLDTTDQAVTLSPSSADVTIGDDDGKSLSISLIANFLYCSTYRGNPCPLLVNELALLLPLGVVVGLQETEYSEGEGNESLSVCVFLNGTAERDVVVTLSAISQTAQGRVYETIPSIAALIFVLISEHSLDSA